MGKKQWHQGKQGHLKKMLMGRRKETKKRRNMKKGPPVRQVLGQATEKLGRYRAPQPLARAGPLPV